MHFTDDVLFGEVWPRNRPVREGTQPGHRLRAGHPRGYRSSSDHLGLAKENGNTEAELKEAITHIAFYAGWPRAMSAMGVAKQVFGD